MQAPLTISPGYPSGIHISDATGRVVCTLPADEMELARAIVRKCGRKWWWPRDARQRAYDDWMMASNAKLR